MQGMAVEFGDDSDGLINRPCVLSSLHLAPSDFGWVACKDEEAYRRLSIAGRGEPSTSFRAAQGDPAIACTQGRLGLGLGQYICLKPRLLTKFTAQAEPDTRTSPM
jgi:hypothetical protein